MIWVENVLVSPGEGGVYGERMLKEYRVWDPYRSKLAAYYYLGGEFELTPDMVVLYLGAANGTTVSHVADYAGTVYAIEFAPRPMQDMVAVARRRNNVVPLMADAAQPERYAPLLEMADLIYQDIAQPEQVTIAIRNRVFLREGGRMLIMLKTRSIDTAEVPGVVLERSVAALEAARITVLDTKWLDPYHKDHAAMLCSSGLGPG
ncbi:MAG: fibrillarin-like rRNA/tRNA 2'-O-methyltransferase [Methanomicrobiales archaeon]|nr:fibrillarin-like rRNA/tRNA 2'-O-methyltransferase [Methanomicrobiales archaeon]